MVFEPLIGCCCIVKPLTLLPLYSFQPKKTPTKSPLPGQFQTLPSLHDAKLTPSGIFLSPSPPPPNSTAGVSSVPTLDDKDKKKPAVQPKEDSKPAAQDEKAAAAATAKARDLERERVVATPTDFSLDFGKGLRPTGSFDASNGKCKCRKDENMTHALWQCFLTVIYLCLCALSIGMASIANSKRIVFAWGRFWVGVWFEYTSCGNCTSYTEDAHKYDVFLLFRCCKFAKEC